MGLQRGGAQPAVHYPLGLSIPPRIRPSPRKKYLQGPFQRPTSRALTAGDLKGSLPVLCSVEPAWVLHLPVISQVCVISGVPRSTSDSTQMPCPATGITEPQLLLASSGHPGFPGIDRASLFTKCFCMVSIFPMGEACSPLYRWETKAQRPLFTRPKSHS